MKWIVGLVLLVGLGFTIREAWKSATAKYATENTVYARKITLSPGQVDYIDLDGNVGRILIGPQATCQWYDHLGVGEPLQIHSWESSNGRTHYRIYTPRGYSFK